MSQRLYTTTRDLHLYLGLFFSPFVLVFSVSVFFLAHAWVPGAVRPGAPRMVLTVGVPPNLEQLDGRERVDAVKAVLNRIGINGEIGFIRHLVKEHLLVVPISIPGRETTVEIGLATHIAKVNQRTTGIWDGLIALHKAPGPHLVAIRMNWLPMRIWRWFADATVYVLFFISISGIYLWTALRSERRVGLVLIAAGAVSFFGILYGLAH